MKHSMPLKNSGFAKSHNFLDRDARLAARAARMANLAEIHRAAPPVARGVIERVIGTAPAQPKEDVSQSDAYERAAKALGYCMRCDRKVIPLTGELDFCHADLGKGQGFKTDCRRGWPGCRTCHEFVGRKLPKQVRRAVEILLAVMTRAAIDEAGTWPKRLPRWMQ